MSHNDSPRVSEAQVREHVTFYVGDSRFGVEIESVQEISRDMAVTKVPHAPPYVRGITNLRGEIVTIIDLATRLGSPRPETTAESRHVFLSHEGRFIGLFVDRIAEVVGVPEQIPTPLPENMGEREKRLLKGVHQMESELLALLDIGKVLEPGN